MLIWVVAFQSKADTHYVSLEGEHRWPYTNWVDAATNVQAAIDAANDNDTVIITNGVYVISSAIVVSKDVSLRSANGAEACTIRAIPFACRCVIVSSSNAVLQGLTLTGGFTTDFGGGLLSDGGTIRDCTIVSNESLFAGGGAYCRGSTVSGCSVDANEAGNHGGGVCIQGGVLEGSAVSGNYAWSFGGGVIVISGTVRNCQVFENSSWWDPGGILVGDFATAVNCTVIGNTAVQGAGGIQVGEGGVARNMIVVHNSPSNWLAGVPLEYSCTAPLPPWTIGNITNDPQLTPSYRLKSSSPCIDAGTWSNAPAADIDGEARWDHPGHPNIVSIVDMGADEFVDTDLDDMADHWESETLGSTTNSNGTTDGDNDDLDDLGEYENSTDPGNPDTDADTMPDGWEVGNDLDPLSDDAGQDPDADTMHNGGEYVADTNPQDPQSVLSVINIALEFGGIRIDWKGGQAAWQFLECRTDLVSTTEQWEAIFAVPPPTPITNAIIDLGATNETLFYRVRAER